MFRSITRVAVPVGMMCACTLASVAHAQGMPNPAMAPNPLTAAVSMLRGNFQNMVTKSADEMPESKFSFKPTKDVRTFAGILNHVAATSYMFCSAIKGETNPHPDSMATKAGAGSKADIMTFLKGAFDYCDGAYSGFTDAHLNDPADFFGNKTSKMFILTLVASHDAEHYGNLVTYLRLNGLVPPSTQQQMAAAPAASH